MYANLGAFSMRFGHSDSSSHLQVWLHNSKLIAIQGNSNILVGFCLSVLVIDLHWPGCLYQSSPRCIHLPVFQYSAAWNVLARSYHLNPGGECWFASYNHWNLSAYSSDDGCVLFSKCTGEVYLDYILWASLYTSSKLAINDRYGYCDCVLSKCSSVSIAPLISCRFFQLMIVSFRQRIYH